MPVIAIITKNGNKKGTIFKMMLRSTLRIPYTHAIMVDDSQDSDTADAARKFMDENGKQFVVVKSNLYGRSTPTRATARQTAIDMFLDNYNDEFLIQLDDDVALRQGWWEEALHAFHDETTGLFYGVPYDVNSEDELLAEKAYPEKIKRAVSVFSQRGGTNDVAFRRKALETVRSGIGIIPPELHIYEDAWLLRAIQCSGYNAVVGTVGAIQFDPLKINRIEGPEIYDIDLKYIKLASKYNIIKSTNVAADLVGILASMAGVVTWSIKYARRLGIQKGTRTAFKRQYIKVLYRYVKIKSALGNTCGSLRSE